MLQNLPQVDKLLTLLVLADCIWRPSAGMRSALLFVRSDPGNNVSRAPDAVISPLRKNIKMYHIASSPDFCINGSAECRFVITAQVAIVARKCENIITIKIMKNI